MAPLGHREACSEAQTAVFDRPRLDLGPVPHVAGIECHRRTGEIRVPAT
jgi:hypothetical protein